MFEPDNRKCAKLAEIEAPVYSGNERKVIGASAAYSSHQRLYAHTMVVTIISHQFQVLSW